jgi:hypothetical protein
MTARNMSPRRASSRFRHAGWVGALAGGVALVAACGSSSTSVASTPPLASTTSLSTTVVYAFSINPSADALIPAPGTTPGVVSEGDESIINDQLTSTHLAGHGASSGYPIIGYDSGTCTFTRVAPDGQTGGSPFNSTLESCAATAVLPNGTVTAQGIITTKSGVPQPATLSVTGGTGAFASAHGVVKVTFGSHFEGQQYETFSIVMQ